MITRHAKIIRTFHPIGQGAFYSERFYDFHGDNCLNIVYDCGVLDVKKRHKNVIRNPLRRPLDLWHRHGRPAAGNLSVFPEASENLQ